MCANVDRFKWAKWQKWAKAIEDDLAIVVDDRNDFDAFRKVVDGNLDWILTHNGGSFLDFVRRGYVANMCMGVRRQLKDHDDSISLMRLMREVADLADAFTFDAYKTLQPLDDPDRFDWRVPTFGKLSNDGAKVSRALIEQHMADAQKVSAEVEELADRVIAHHDKRGSSVKLTFEQLNAPVAHFDELAQKYIQFFTGAQMAEGTLGANPLYDPAEVFRHPLVKPPELAPAEPSEALRP